MDHGQPKAWSLSAAIANEPKPGARCHPWNSTSCDLDHVDRRRAGAKCRGRAELAPCGPAKPPALAANL